MVPPLNMNMLNTIDKCENILKTTGLHFKWVDFVVYEFYLSGAFF